MIISKTLSKYEFLEKINSSGTRRLSLNRLRTDVFGRDSFKEMSLYQRLLRYRKQGFISVEIHNKKGMIKGHFSITAKGENYINYIKSKNLKNGIK